jgi:hypothetical protein
MPGSEDDTAAQVFAIGAVLNSLIHALQRTGALSGQDVDKILDDSLTGLERAEAAIDDESTKRTINAARREAIHLFPSYPLSGSRR